MTSNPKVDVLMTGGTIDAKWDPVKDTAVTAGESVIPAYFQRIKLDVDLTFTTVCMKDSRKLLPEDLEKICQAVDNSPNDKVLITHGTYTMPDTARYLINHLTTRKAVVLTGSLIPLAEYAMTDASFNLGFALATLLHMESGVIISIHGNTFEPADVAKNLAEAHFFSIAQ